MTGKFAVSLLGLVASLAVAVPASATNFTMRNAKTGLCLGVQSANPADGTAVVTWDCDESTNQTWHEGEAFDGTGQYFHIVNHLTSNRCLGLNASSKLTNNFCNNDDSDNHNQGWWGSYIGDLTIPGETDPQHCFVFASYTNPFSQKVITTTADPRGNQPVIADSTFDPNNNKEQVWCLVDAP
ncbi:MAG: RICIN domain-containing protein [Pseudomonadota bacterium]